MARRTPTRIAMNLERIGSGKEPVPGDLFGISVRGCPFLFGRVIKTGIVIMDFDIALIYIYDKRSTEMILPEHLGKENLLMPPMLVEMELWRKGYVRTLANREIKPSEVFKVHCFHHPVFDRYLDEQGEELPRKFEPCGIYGVTPYTGFDNIVSRALGVPEAP